MKHRIVCVLLTISMLILCLPQNIIMASTPFKKLSIPGEIRTVDFDIGDEGETYSGYKTATWEGRFNYRGADIKMNFYNGANGIILGMNSGEWTKYTVNVAQSGEYIFYAKYATQNLDVLVRLTFDDTVELNVDLPTTESWQETVEYELGKVNLSAGTHEMRLDMLNRGVNFVSLIAESAETVKIDYRKKTGPYRLHMIPCTIQAEDFDLGADGCVSRDGKNDYRKYRPDDPMNIGEIVKNSEYYLSMAESEATVYTFVSEVGANYDIYVSSSTAGNINLYLDDHPYPMWSELKSGNGYEEKKVTTVYIPKGTHKLRVMTESQLDMDYIKILTSNETGARPEELDKSEYPVKSENDSDEEIEDINPVWRELYVSPDGADDAPGTAQEPFKTIQRAVSEVEKIRSEMEGDIVVHIASGIYKLEETVELGAASGGINGYKVIYRGDENDLPVLSGGTRITGWKRVEGDSRLWVAPADDVEEVRNFYVNDKPTVRARSKYRYLAKGGFVDENSNHLSDGMILSSVNFPSHFDRPDELECVWDSEWTMHRYPVADVVYNDDSTASVYMKQPFWNNLKHKSVSPNDPGEAKPFYFENAREFLDETGEFWFDTQEKKIYYYPYPEEDLQTAGCYAATKEFLMNIRGDSVEKPISGVKIENIQFKYGAWHRVSKEGLQCNQADNVKVTTDSMMKKDYIIPGQVTVEYADNITISNCRFKCLGSTGLLMANAVTNSDVCGNVFTDISAGAVTVGHWDHLDTMAKSMARCEHIKLRHNVLRRIAEEYRGSPALMMYYVNSVNCSYNDLEDVAYTGISLGWGWGRVVEGMANNTIAFNRIVDVCAPTNDSAHIYTLGPMKGSTIHDNYCTISGDYRGGIYLDEGTAHVKVFKNVIEKPQLYWFNARAQVKIKNIYAYDNYTDSERYEIDPANVTLENTTYVKDGNWPAEAVAIREKAGVGGKYKYLLDEDIDLPSWHRDYIHDVPKSRYFAKTNAWTQAEDFDIGGEGIAYHKIKFGTHANDRIFYRPEGVDVWVSNNKERDTWNVGDTVADEWLAYTLDVPQTKDYEVEITYSNFFPVTDPDTKVSVYMDGALVIDSADMPRTASWGDYHDIIVGTVSVPKGTHTFKIQFVDNGFSFDRWRLKDGPDRISGNEEEFDEGVYVDYDPTPKPDPYAVTAVPSFTDTIGHWAEDDIMYMRKRGIVNGVSDTEYAPNRSISLYETIWLTLRIMRKEHNDENWRQIAYDLGLLDSVSEGDRYISRERFAYNVMKIYMSYKGEYLVSVGKEPYKDMQNVSERYNSSVRGAYVQQLMIGDDQGMFRPTDTLTRAEAAVVLKRLMQKAGM